MALLPLRTPAGYHTLVALNRQEHAGLGLAPRTHHWCAALNALYLNAAEFAAAAVDYPIVFTRDEDSGEFMPVALFALRSGENLFVDPQGNWAPHRYLPAYVRRHPFCIAEIPDPQGHAPQRLVCFEQGALVPSASPLFGPDGRPSADWDTIQRLLEAVEASRQQTRVLCRRLDALGLMTPFEALAMPRGRQRMRLQGLFRIDEEKLNAVPGKDLRVMQRKGELRCAYAHLVSLENFSRLMDMTVERDQQSAAPA